ncbi:MAG TPA: hypothetical protein VJ783_09855 [Pirellulales bacterium]|nr:hypothetical protein [Pirellulales bacterium]
MASTQSKIRFAVCVANDGCDDLTARKIYRILPDDDAAREDFLRVVDDSGEDYLYPADRFVPVRVAKTSQQRLLAAVASEVN